MVDVQNSNGTINSAVPQLEDLYNEPTGWLDTTLSNSKENLKSAMKKHRSKINILMIIILNGLVLGFFIASWLYWANEEPFKPLEICNGFGSLITVLSIIYFFIIYFKIIKRFFGEWFAKTIWIRVESCVGYLWKIKLFKYGFILLIVAAIAVFLYFDTVDAPERLISLIGLFLLLFLGFVFSAYPGRINWRTVVMGLVLQFIFGLIFIRWDAGRIALQCFSDKVATFLMYGVDGAAFTFGDLLVREESVFAFSVLPVIFFFSMLVEVLFYWGALQAFCLKLGQVLRSATSITVCESVIAVGNVFLGNTESALLVKPYLSLLTPSEMHVVMGSGFATVSGTILAAYINFGAEPAHLVTASVMSAPAAICFCKLLMPETKRSLTAVDNIQQVESQDESALSAATRGATNGIALVLNIIANLVAFLAFIAFVNGVLGYCGNLLGFEGLNLEWIFGKVFIPLCWVMGVPWVECEHVATLIGLKTVVNEFVAYQRMGEMKELGLLSPRSELIATYSLCGFTNPSSAAIMIGAISSMAPNQRETLSGLAVRAFFAGCAICFMTACIAAILMPEGSF
ncbi:putative transporter YutK [Aphomia sociella]